MAKLPEYQSRGNILRAPQSSVSASDVANPFQQIAEGLGGLSDMYQKRDLFEASNDGENNGVFRDSSGQLHVDQRSNLSATGRNYNAAATQHYGVMAAGEIRLKLAQLSIDAKGNVDNFRASSEAYRNEFLKGAPKELQGAVASMFDQEAPKVMLGLSEEKRKRDLKLTEQSTKDHIQLLMDDASALARDGGVNTKSYQQSVAQIKTLYQGLVDNPDFVVSQDSVDVAMKRMQSQNMSEAMLGQVDKALKVGGVTEARRLANDVLTNPDLHLDPKERRQYSGLMNSQIEGFVADTKANLKPFQTQATVIQKRMKQGIGLDEPDVDDTAQQLARGGDIAGAMELLHARTSAKILGDFKLSDNATQTATAEQYLSSALKPAGDVVDRIINIESSGNPNAKNPKSSAAGLGQFIDSTWLNMIHKYRPDVAEGKSAKEIVALKSDPSLSKEMTGRYVSENAEFLRNQGISASDGDIYLAHFLGPRGASQVIKGDPGAAISTVVDQSVIDANPFMRGKTIAEVRDWANKKMGSASGTVADIDPDVVKDMRSEVTSDVNDAYPGIKRTLQSGLPLESGSLSLLSRQLAMVDDQDVKQKYRDLFATADAAHQLDNVAPAEREALMAGLNADAQQGATVAQSQMIQWAQDSAKAKDEALKTDPIGYAIARKFVDPLPALDTADPSSWAGSLQAQQRAVDVMQARGEVGNISALRPEQQQQVANLWQEGDPNKLTALTNSLATGLDPETLRATLSNGPVKEALKGAVLSTDPVKYGEAMKQLDLLANNGKTSMLDLQNDFGEEAVNRLQDWQGMVRYYTPEETQRWLKERNDPAWQERTRPLVAKGETEARKVSADDIVSKLDTNRLLDTVGPVDEQTQRMMQDDFVRLSGMRNGALQDPAKAQEQAVERMKKVWGVTSAYGNTRGRLMPYPPEAFYPDIGGSHDWIGAELAGIAASHSVPMDNISLVADGKTKAAIDNKQVPGYMISVVNKDTGMEELMTDDQGRPIRHFFDPKAAQVNIDAQAAEMRRTRNDPWLVIGKDFGIGPFYGLGGADPADLEMNRRRASEIGAQQKLDTNARREKQKAAKDQLDKLGVPGDPFGGQ